MDSTTLIQGHTSISMPGLRLSIDWERSINLSLTLGFNVEPERTLSNQLKSKPQTRC